MTKNPIHLWQDNKPKKGGWSARMMQKVMAVAVSMAFLLIFISGCGDGDSGDAAWVAAANTAGTQTYYDEVVIQLDWVRSYEDPEDVPSSTTLGGAVDLGLTLPLDPAQMVFDNGEHTPEANINATPPDNDWAS